MTYLLALLILSLALAPLDAFLSTPARPLATTRDISSLSAKRSRRRRKKEKPSPSADSAAPASDDLPDFDLDGEGDEASPKPAASVSTNPDEISANMMGSVDTPVRTLDELISDRTLESKFEFDESQVDKNIPDLADLVKGSSNGSGGTASTAMSSSDGNRMTKSARNQARREAAQARDAMEEEESILDKVPFIRNDEGEVTFNKVLEGGAWLGIMLLVLWEVYINSPLFERAAPMAPVVY